MFAFNKLVSVFVKNSLHLIHQTTIMKPYKFLFSAIITISIFNCKSSVKQKEDSVYSRHMQRKVPITIISTKMPDKKEDMNLLLFSNSSLLEQVRAKKIIDSLVKDKLIQPLILVAFDGNESDYGIEESNVPAAKQYKKFNEFVVDELLPYIKKHAVIRKFNSVALCGFQNAAISAFGIAWNNDEKIQKIGMFSPNFSMETINNDDATFQLLQTSRKRPKLNIFIAANGIDSSEIKFKAILDSKASITACKLLQPNLSEAEMKTKPTMRNFAEFLVWAFPR
jgi:hypothetical protein